jgi:hypothetical protein
VTFPRRHRHGFVAAVVAVALGALVPAACGSSPAARRAVRTAGATGEATAAIAPLTNCPVATYPPAAPYELTVSGTITGSLTIRHNSNNRFPSIVPDIRARFCGTLGVPAESGAVPAVDIHFAPAHLYLGYHRTKSGKATYTQVYGLKLIPLGVATASVVRSPAADGAAPDGGLELEVDTQVTTVVTLSTARCDDGPVALQLSTQLDGGSDLIGPLTHTVAVVAQKGFTVPAVKAQASCNLGGIPYYQALNATLFLPATDTSTAEKFTIRVGDH